MRSCALSYPVESRCTSGTPSSAHFAWSSPHSREHAGQIFTPVMMSDIAREGQRVRCDRAVGFLFLERGCPLQPPQLPPTLTLLPSVTSDHREKGEGEIDREILFNTI